jgi:hypothetical protein
VATEVEVATRAPTKPAMSTRNRVPVATEEVVVTTKPFRTPAPEKPMQLTQPTQPTHPTQPTKPTQPVVTT